jgi:hypothetical protein
MPRFEAEFQRTIFTSDEAVLGAELTSAFLEGFTNAAREPGGHLADLHLTGSAAVRDVHIGSDGESGDSEDDFKSFLSITIEFDADSMDEADAVAERIAEEPEFLNILGTSMLDAVSPASFAFDDGDFECDGAVPIENGIPSRQERATT